MDGADQRRPHRLRGPAPVLTILVALLAQSRLSAEQRLPHAVRRQGFSDAEFPRPGAMLSMSRRVCYQAGLRLPRVARSRGQTA
jgi:hypothetical protein